MSFEANRAAFGSNHLNHTGTVAPDAVIYPAIPDPEILGFADIYPIPALNPTIDAVLSGPAHPATANVAFATVGATAPAVQTQASASSGLVIIANYDSSIANLQTSSPTQYAGITGAITAAIHFYETHFTNAITLNIDFGFGEENGTPLGSGVLGQSSRTTFQVDPYSAVKSLLTSHATSTDDKSAVASLPASDPTSVGIFTISQAEARSLGLASAADATIDGHVGISSSNAFTYDPSHRAVAGEYDAIGVLEHEISEVMGRVQSLGVEFGSDIYTPFDLFRYSASGVRALSPGPGYFSIDGGQTNLGQFNNPNGGGDTADWANSVTADSYDDITAISVANTVSVTDLRVMDVLGYARSSAAACYVAGTHIQTSRGEIPVEDLAAGDLVQSRFAGLVPIKWIGQRRIDCRRHADPRQVLPVRIIAGAFGPGLPIRDLWLSPDHAVAVDNLLIPIRRLVNGASISQETDWTHVRYFHIELQRHDLLLANGLPAESYLDTGNRGVFDNARVPILLHPWLGDPAAQTMREALSCLPFCRESSRVEPVWHALAARAVQLEAARKMPPATEDPALCVTAGKRRFAPLQRHAGRYTFVLPALPSGCQLRSRCVVPSVLHPWLKDERQLGVMVRRMSRRRGDERLDLALDDPSLARGWWEIERDATGMWRWTDGNAELPPSNGPLILEVLIGQALSYPENVAKRPVETTRTPLEQQQAA